MNIFRSVLKKDIVTNCLKRKFHGTPKLFNSDCTREPMEIKHPFYLEPIVSENHTIKDHDNERRQTLYEFGIYVAACMPKYVQKVQIQHNDELEILVCPDGLFPVLSFMCHHQHACFNALSAETAMDVPSRPYRFEVSYNLLSLRFGERARIKTYTDELTPLHSGFPLYQVCHTFEREIYDMYGIIFTHHPDLRRILTDYGFSGHPLRKDFPLVGYTEVRYDDSLKKLVYEPVEFAQEMRKYAVNSPWNYSKNFHEGFNNALPKKETE